MEWINNLKHLSSYWEAGLLAFLTLTVCLSYFQTIRAPRYTAETGELARRSPRLIAAWETELEALKFQRIGCFSWAATRGVTFVARAYLSADGQHVGVVHNSVAMVSGRAHAVTRTAKVLLLTQLSPRGIMATDNGKTEDVILFVPERVAVAAPWKRSAESVFRLHLRICQAAQENHFEILPADPMRVGELLGALTRKYYEYLAGKGLVKPAGADAYRMTLKGVVICTPVLFWNFSYSWLHHLFRPSDQTLYHKIHQRLQSLRSVS
jgi:hypothetical protein